MSAVHCPSCGATLALVDATDLVRSAVAATLDGEHAVAPQPLATVSQLLTEQAAAGRAAVRQFLEAERWQGSSHPNAALREAYGVYAAVHDLPELSDKAFSRALLAAGATPWRTATTRGWRIP
jgi:hypothetical protein